MRIPGNAARQVWNDGASDRVVLLFDMWHPELDLERDIIPTLTEDEKAAVAAARSGKHLRVTMRDYTSAASVKR